MPHGGPFSVDREMCGVLSAVDTMRQQFGVATMRRVRSPRFAMASMFATPCLSGWFGSVLLSLRTPPRIVNDVAGVHVYATMRRRAPEDGRPSTRDRTAAAALTALRADQFRVRHARLVGSMSGLTRRMTDSGRSVYAK